MTREAPASLSASLWSYRFVCPACRGELEALADAYRCASCGRIYPLLAGIPDFRIFPDPYLSVEEDRARAEAILREIDRLTFSELLEHYWSMSDVTPERLRRRFVESALRGRDRARRVLRGLEKLGEPRLERVLDVGSGTGNFLVEGASRFREIVGVDIAMRWLHLSRRRLRDEGLPEPALVCCCAEALPFPDSAFDGVVSIAALEFARDADRFVDECARVLAPGGALMLNTVNRFSLAPEPHVALWGVGWLPRAWQPRYVRWRRRASFENLRLLSYGRLIRMLRRGFESPRSAVPDFAVVPPQPTRPRRLAVRALRTLARFAAGRALLDRVGPEWDVAARKKGTARDGEPAS